MHLIIIIIIIIIHQMAASELCVWSVSVPISRQRSWRKTPTSSLCRTTTSSTRRLLLATCCLIVLIRLLVYAVFIFSTDYVLFCIAFGCLCCGVHAFVNPTIFLHVPYMSTDFGRRAFSYSSPAAWNSIPIAIKNCSSLYSFKRHLKSYFIAQLTNN